MLKNETKPKKDNICSSKALVYIAMENSQKYRQSGKLILPTTMKAASD